MKRILLEIRILVSKLWWPLKGPLGLRFGRRIVMLGAVMVKFTSVLLGCVAPTVCLWA